MSNPHASSDRIHAGLWWLAGALLGVSLSPAASAAVSSNPAFNNFLAQSTGNRTTVAFGSGGQPLVTTASSALPTGAGWTQAGNMGLATKANGDIGMAANVSAPIAGGIARAPMAVETGFTRANFLKGLGAMGSLVGGWPGVALIGGIALADYLMTRGVSFNQLDPTGDKPFKVKEDSSNCTESGMCTYYSATWLPRVWRTSITAACNDELGYRMANSNGDWRSYSLTGIDGFTCVHTVNFQGTTYQNQRLNVLSMQAQQTGAAATRPITVVEMQGIMADAPVTPQAFLSLYAAQGLPVANPVAVSGPAAVAGPAASSSGTAGATTNNTTYNITYEGSTYTYTTTVVTTSTPAAPASGASAATPPASAASSTTTTSDDKKPDYCEEHPDALACAQLDKDDGKVAKVDKNITYQAESVLGGGSCPAEQSATIHGKSYQLTTWSQTCSVVSMYVRPIVLVVAAFVAMMIVAGIRTEASS